MPTFSTLQLALLVLSLPVGTFFVLAILNRFVPRRGDWLALLAMGGSLLSALVIFKRAWMDGGLLLDFTFPWLPTSGSSGLSGGIMVDSLSAVMMIVVTVISFLVYLFSTKYMEGDLRYGRFYCSLLLFSSSMLGLVLANSLLYLFIFWELVGLSSYLLIGHWYEKKSASNAAIKAFITTRIGDIGMLIGLLICYKQAGSLHFADIFASVQTGTLSGTLRTVAGLGIFFGAMGKSAQFPLHVWLPDAMEGPTPVSALIHAATMVAAGVYLVGRMLPLFDEQTLLLIAHIGAFTALFSATIALVQDDIKRVLAYSTVSQLGYMTMALGTGGYVSGLFHLTTHAFFKAGLFLGSGAVIHAMHHEQSMSKYGGLFRKMPKTATCYLLSTLALVGFPFFSGFWSKDAILADALAAAIQGGYWFLPIAGFGTVLLTAFYMFRQYFLTFTGKPRDKHAFEHAHETPWAMLIPLIILAALSVGSGGFGEWFSVFAPKQNAIQQIGNFAGEGYTSRLVSEALLSPASPVMEEHGTTEHLLHLTHSTAMTLSTILAFLGIGIAALFYFERKDKGTIFDPAKLANALPKLHKLLLNKYYIDEIFEAFFVFPICKTSSLFALFDHLVIDGLVNFVAYVGRIISVITEIVDRVGVDGLFVMGTARSAGSLGNRLAQAQTGYIRQYLLFTVIALLAVSTLVLLF